MALNLTDPSTTAPDAEPQRRPGHRGLLSRVRSVPGIVKPFVVILVVIVLMGVGGEAIAPHDPTAQSLRNRFAVPWILGGGNPDYLLGGDQLGRDVLSRIIAGARISLTVAIGGLVIAGLLGTVVGLVAGYCGGVLDEALMSVADVQLAFPNVLLAIAVIAVLGPSLINLIVVLGVTGWVTYARVARGAVLGLRRSEFVEAVRCLGGGHVRIVLRHILPNCASLLIVVATLHLARIIILESTLSFLGLGIQPPTPSWGGMISEGRAYLSNAWWISLCPGAVLLLTAMSVSRIGDWLRDVLDPTLRSS